MKKISLVIFLLAFFPTAQAFAEKKVAKNTATKTSDSAQEITASPKQIASEGFADAVEELLPTVVNISATQDSTSGNTTIDQALLGDLPKSPLLDDFRNQVENQFRGQSGKKKISSIGSGFIISKDGFIVTNNHVIEDADDIIISLSDGAKYKAKVVGFDKKTDLCLLKINADRDLKFAKFGDSDKARIGDWTIIIGNPYGLGGSVSVGIVSARSRDLPSGGQGEDFIQTDAAINKGNSGGPMFNLKGEVIGISTSIYSPSGGSIGIGFVRPAASAVQVIKQLKDQGEVTRGWLGISIQEVTEEIAESIKMDKPKGAFVNEVSPDGPAEKAGILPTDIIIKFNDQEINEMKTLPKLVAKFPIDKTSKITVLRQGKIKTFNVKVLKMKEDDDAKKSENKPFPKKQAIKPALQLLGLGVVELDSNLKKERAIDNATKGLFVADVAIKSEAAEKGIMLGDVILSVNQAPITSVEEFKKAIADAVKSNKKLFVFLKRSEKNYGVVLTAK
jgi:serine protease Do